MDILWAWGEAFLRWAHVIAAVGWIGSSFYFVHLDLSLRQRPSLPPDASGDTWQVHGGGFYHMIKYMVAPAKMPDDLTWFKWEAYTTWLSGIALLIAIYYLSAPLYLIDKEVLDLSPAWGALLSAAILVAGWAAYDFMCRSELGNNEALLAAIGFALLVALSYAFTLLFSSRGAFMELGALIGTIMAANVLMVVIPGQRKVVAALLAGETPNPIYGKRGKQRSVHNNYLTLPVIFVMIGNHYPMAFATRWNWVIWSLIIVAGAAIRHFINMRHRKNVMLWWTLGAAAACGFAIIVLSMQGPAKATQAAVPIPAKVAFVDVESVVATRCSMCHAAEPLWPGVAWPPKGVMLDSPENIRLHRKDIAMQAVLTSAMPPSNITDITPEERAILAAWSGESD
ncbi:MAG: urate hydroxylase PuuD [Rhodomicrobium sp.]